MPKEHSIGERDMKFLFKKIECINLKGIVKVIPLWYLAVYEKY